METASASVLIKEVGELFSKMMIMAAVYFSGKGVVYSRASSGTMINNTGDGMAEEEYLGQRQLASSEPEHLLWMA